MKRRGRRRSRRRSRRRRRKACSHQQDVKFKGSGVGVLVLVV